MAAIPTLAQASSFRKSGSGSPQRSTGAPPVVPLKLQPRRGVVVLSGYGSSVRVERGHLIIEDGIGNERHKGRLPRVGHGLERLIVVGADGVVSLSALRWLADQKASFVMLERDGRVLATTGPVRPSDVRLRRAQALAQQTDLAFRMSRELIDRKLAGQERVARESLKDEKTATMIRQLRSELAEVESIDAIRTVEARAAKVYWKAWRTVTIRFPAKDVSRVPEHWQSFGARASVLTGSPRLAVNPVNALLNYLYALLEAECRLAIAALGLDPGMGVLHMDTNNRDSFACDLMEPIRPDVDAYILLWIARQPLKRGWFFEERNGNCRLMADLTTQLAQTASTWERLVAPLAEWAVKQIASTTRTRISSPATRLTQNHKRALTGREFVPESEKSVTPTNVCSVCGKETGSENTRCWFCNVEIATERVVRVAAEGRVVSHSDEAETKRSRTQ
jgi:CRISPR-associated endonuclease Cas1